MTKIRGIKRLEETLRRTGGSGDNWHMTWAKNDIQYTALCDGKGWPDVVGFQDEEYNSRVLEIHGYENPSFHHIPGFPELKNYWGTPLSSRYYGFGIIAIDDHIYHFMSTPNHPFFPEPDPRFFGAKLIYSPDLGKTWNNQDGSSPVVWEPWEERSNENMIFFNEPGESFSLLTLLQMGKNYEHNQDGYVYIYAPNGNLEGSMNQLVLCRVRKEDILHRSKYEFYVSSNEDGSAVWSSSINNRGVVHTFPSGWVNTQVHPYSWHPSVVYNPGLGVYMMLNWGIGCASDGMWFDVPSYLGVWTADQPWGPWTQVHEETAWMPGGDAGARAYQPQISPKWIAEDGKSFWLVWTDFQLLDDKRPYYCFNWQKVEILT